MTGPWTLEARHRLLGGQLSWKELAKGEPGWLCPALAATVAARDRLASWCAGGGLQRVAPSEAEIERAVQFVGDEEVLPLVSRVLARVPPPVRDHSLTNAWIVGVGRSTHGYVALAPPQRLAERDEPLKLVVLAVAGLRDDDACSLIAHELAHHWLLRWSAPASATVTTVAEAREHHDRLLTFARDWDVLPQVLAPIERDEREAAELCRVWGFEGIGSDSDDRVRGAVLGEEEKLMAALARRGEVSTT
jgi:hypothetical protein